MSDYNVRGYHLNIAFRTSLKATTHILSGPSLEAKKLRVYQDISICYHKAVASKGALTCIEIIPLGIPHDPLYGCPKVFLGLWTRDPSLHIIYYHHVL